MCLKFRELFPSKKSFEEFIQPQMLWWSAPCYGGVVFAFSSLSRERTNVPLGETRVLHSHLIDVLSPLSQSETPVRLVVGLFKVPQN